MARPERSFEQGGLAVIGVGIIGVHPHRGWAATAHIPALQALGGFEVRAVSSTQLATARAAASEFGVPLAFDDHRELIRRPEIDLVTVTVRAPGHAELVEAALNAGKAVYCEWPLGTDLREATALADLADARGISTVIGLQGRQAAAVRYARDLVADGFVGEVLSSTLVTTLNVGDEIAAANAYMLNESSGANLLSIGVGHSVDALCTVLGELTEVAAVSALRRPSMKIHETGDVVRKTAPDQIAFVGRTGAGAVVVVHARESIAGGTGLFWEINGTAGTLRLTAAGGLPGIFPMTIAGSRFTGELPTLTIPARYERNVPALIRLAGSPADNVGRTYAAFAADRASGAHTAPGFGEAVTRHRTLAAVQESARTGATLQIG